MSMIEKVAEVLYNNTYSKVSWMPQWSDKAADYLKADYIEAAKLAISAMRDPTDEMLKAFYGDIPIENWLGQDWRDMIDAALKE